MAKIILKFAGCFLVLVFSVLGMYFGTVNLWWHCNEYECHTRVLPNGDCYVEIVDDENYGCKTNLEEISSYCKSNSTFTCYKKYKEDCPPFIECEPDVVFALLVLFSLFSALSSITCAIFFFMLHKISRDRYVHDEYSSASDA